MKHCKTRFDNMPMMTIRTRLKMKQFKDLLKSRGLRIFLPLKKKLNDMLLSSGLPYYEQIGQDDL